MMRRRRVYIDLSVVCAICFAAICFTGCGSRRAETSVPPVVLQADTLLIADADTLFIQPEDTLPELVTPPESMPVSLVVQPEAVDLDWLRQTLTIPIVDSLCIVEDGSNSLSSFFEELNKLRSRQDTVVNIVHLGDSHVQAGYLSGRTMRLFHNAFGNAGRGWIAPLKLAKLNEPDDYFLSTFLKEWQYARITQRTKNVPVGLGGIGVQSASPSINFDVVITPVNGAGYMFNQAVLYRSDKAMPMLPAESLKDSIHSRLGAEAIISGLATDTFFIDCLTDTLQLQSTRRLQGTDSILPASNFTNIYYGFNLMNGAPGVLYHSIGINGAMHVNFTDDAYVRQLAALKPSLLIISLGTNETFGARFRSAEFSGQVRALLSLVRMYMPETAILLTTPPECYRRVRQDGKRVYVRNSNTELAAKAIVDVARKEGIACFDLFEATGGKNSNRVWHEKKLMRVDRIHFTKEGYQDQGTMLFLALMRLYNTQFTEQPDLTEGEISLE